MSIPWQSTIGYRGARRGSNNTGLRMSSWIASVLVEPESR